MLCGTVRKKVPGDRVAFQGNSHEADRTGKRDLNEHTPQTGCRLIKKIIRKNKGNAFRNNYPEGIFVCYTFRKTAAMGNRRNKERKR